MFCKRHVTRRLASDSGPRQVGQAWAVGPDSTTASFAQLYVGIRLVQAARARLRCGYRVGSVARERSLFLPADQALPKVEAILVALQCPHPAGAPALGVRLLDAQHAPVGGDVDNAAAGAGLGLEGDGLARVEPVAVVAALEVAGEAAAAELGVDGLEARQDAGEEHLEAQRRGVRGQQVGQGGGRARVGGVDADAEDDLVRAVTVAALREQAANFDVLRGLGGVEGVLQPSAGG